MQVSLHEGPTLVGTATIEHLDPPMGVAFGPFEPSEHYSRDRHANVIEGEFVEDRGRILTASADRYGVLRTRTVAIEDWTNPSYIELTLLFSDGNDFAEVFSTHADYIAYYPHLGNGS
jgi:hypothetical protein